MSSARKLALAGVVGPAAFMLLMAVAGLIRPGYDPVVRAGSDLAVGDNGWLQTLNFFLFGVLLVVFSLAVRRGVAGGRAVTVAAILMAIAGVGLMVAGAFPTDLPGERVTSTHGSIHFLGSLLVFIPLLVVPFLLARPFRRDALWADYDRAAAVFGLIGIVLFIALFFASPAARYNSFQAGPLAAWMGLIQRAFLLVVFGFVELMGVRLFVLSGRPRDVARSAA